MQKTVNRIFKALILTTCLVGFVRAQDIALTGKPCVILNIPPQTRLIFKNWPWYNTFPETLKGTCYYDTNGAASYWIVRWFNVNRNIPTIEENADESKEFVGYAAALKEQKRYNDEIGLALRDVPYHGPPYGKCGKNIKHYYVYAPPQEDCWEHRRLNDPLLNDSGLAMNIPSKILETGELNAETLRIPLFKTGNEILRAQNKYRVKCFSADIDIGRIERTQSHATAYTTHEPAKDSGDKIGFCDPGEERLKNTKLAHYQSLLQSIGAQLDVAQTAAQQYDAIINEYYMSSMPTAHPVELADRLAALQISMETHLRKAEELDKLAEKHEVELRELATKYKHEFNKFSEMKDSQRLKEKFPDLFNASWNP